MPAPACCRCACLCFCFALFCACFAKAQSVDRLRSVVEEAPVEVETTRRATPKLVSSSASVSKLLSFSIPLSRREAITVSTEYMRLSTFHVKTQAQYDKPDWTFKGVPITLGYERTLKPRVHGITPVMGLGASLYLCSVRNRLGDVDPALVAANPKAQYQTQQGLGYGVHASLGLRMPVTRHLFVQAQGRYRYILGHGIDTGTLPSATFPMFDFAVGIGVTL